mgnify:CR=1 FL=1
MRNVTNKKGKVANSSKQISVKFRRSRVVEMILQGQRINDIAKELGVHRQTITRDKQVIGELSIIDELIRIQLEAIHKCSKEDLRLRYRSELIRILRPRKVENKINEEISKGEYTGICPKCGYIGKSNINIRFVDSNKEEPHHIYRESE